MNMTRFFTDDADLRTLLKDFSLFPLRDVVKDWQRLLIFDEQIKDTFFDYHEWILFFKTPPLLASTTAFTCGPKIIGTSATCSTIKLCS